MIKLSWWFSLKYVLFGVKYDGSRDYICATDFLEEISLSMFYNTREYDYAFVIDNTIRQVIIEIDFIDSSKIQKKLVKTTLRKEG